ncbi:hypothetical protein M9458_035079, partial [Cirrhinus mrigala]
GTEGSLPCSEVTEGGGVGAVHFVGEEQGTGDSLSHHRPPGGRGALSRPPKELQYHRMAPRVKDAQLELDQEFFFPFSSLPSLVSVSPPPSVSFPLASSVFTPSYAAAALIGVERSLEGTPGLRGAMGVYVTSGAGPRAVGTERGR